MVKRGEVWLAALDPTVGSEIRKTRPVLVVSPDELNASLRTVIVVPLTGRGRASPFRVPMRFGDKDGLALPDQLRTVDRQRLLKRLGRAKAETLTGVLTVLSSMFER